MSFSEIISTKIFRYGFAVSGIFVSAFIFENFQTRINSTTAALAFLLWILISATFFGRNPALLSSLAAMLCFNFFFLPPFRTLTISDPQNLVAWGAFTVTAIIAGELSAYAGRRALEAEKQKLEIERLYNELQNAFEKASHAEALKQSEKLKSSLLDAVTHDLRTPLTSIKASVTTLLDSEGGHRTIEVDAESRFEFLEIINEETDRLNNFIEGMVELARVEAGSLRLRQKLSSVEEIISTAIKRAENLLKNHRIRIELEKDLPLVTVDAKALAEVVYTLLDNAAKYSPENSLITIKAAVVENEVKLSVNDVGKGIAEEIREKVFEKFFRAESKVVGGLGLGLAIARGIIESHNGKIWIETGDNEKGTKIVLTIPIEEEK
ncbi:MAG TPA: DUF4118 domain-containing protein [Pyrinomonadaceae bacterium]|nr:DUF4118 domain-containing protein [Pyrinomonadaceae bacterium]